MLLAHASAVTIIHLGLEKKSSTRGGIALHISKHTSKEIRAEFLNSRLRWPMVRALIISDSKSGVGIHPICSKKESL